MLRQILRSTVVAVAAIGLSAGSMGAEDNPGDERLERYLEAIQDRLPEEHPRLVIPESRREKVREMALGPMAESYAKVRRRVNDLPETFEPADWGHEVRDIGLVWIVEEDPELVDQIVEMLSASLKYYHARYESREPVSWYGWSRAGWLLALDWVWNEISPEQRAPLAKGMLRHIREFKEFGRNIPSEAVSGPKSGFYGMQANFWYAGLLFANTGYDDAFAEQLLEEGLRLHVQMLLHRERGAGKTGGGASPTLAYLLGNYPMAKWLFFHSWEGAFGESLAADWPSISLLPHYIDWNWLPGNVEFGYGDKVFTDNRFPGYLNLHLTNIIHFYGEDYPNRAAFAEHVRRRAIAYRGETLPTSRLMGVFPFLLSEGLDVEPWEPDEWPIAQAFPEMGQVFFRSGQGDDDTYAMLTGGGVGGSHRHFDAGHFTIYRSGFVALDAGTREGGRDHLVNFFAQTIAHNSVLIDMPGEEPTNYWGDDAEVHEGGQNRRLGSEIAGFHSGENFAFATIDMTPVYHREKQDRVQRWFMFFPPKRFVVIDVVEATEERFKKTWLLQAANEATEIDSGIFRLDQDQGRLFVETILPRNAVIEVAGGPGQEFEVAGKNFPVTDKALENGKVPELMGRWRLKVSAERPARKDLFVHFLEATEIEQNEFVRPDVSSEGGHLEIRFPVPAGEAIVRVAENGSSAPRVEIRSDGRIVESK